MRQQPLSSINETTGYVLSPTPSSIKQGDLPTIDSEKQLVLPPAQDDAFQSSKKATPKLANPLQPAPKKHEEKNASFVWVGLIALASLGLGVGAVLTARHYNWFELGKKAEKTVVEKIPETITTTLKLGQEATKEQVTEEIQTLQATIVRLQTELAQKPDNTTLQNELTQALQAVKAHEVTIAQLEAELGKKPSPIQLPHSSSSNPLTLTDPNQGENITVPPPSINSSLTKAMVFRPLPKAFRNLADLDLAIETIAKTGGKLDPLPQTPEELIDVQKQLLTKLDFANKPTKMTKKPAKIIPKFLNPQEQSYFDPEDLKRGVQRKENLRHLRAQLTQCLQLDNSEVYSFLSSEDLAKFQAVAWFNQYQIELALQYNVETKILTDPKQVELIVAKLQESLQNISPTSFDENITLQTIREYPLTNTYNPEGSNFTCSITHNELPSLEYRFQQKQVDEIMEKVKGFSGSALATPVEKTYVKEVLPFLQQHYQTVIENMSNKKERTDALYNQELCKLYPLILAESPWTEESLQEVLNTAYERLQKLGLDETNLKNIGIEYSQFTMHALGLKNPFKYERHIVPTQNGSIGATSHLPSFIERINAAKAVDMCIRIANSNTDGASVAEQAWLAKQLPQLIQYFGELVKNTGDTNLKQLGKLTAAQLQIYELLAKPVEKKLVTNDQEKKQALHNFAKEVMDIADASIFSDPIVKQSIEDYRNSSYLWQRDRVSAYDLQNSTLNMLREVIDLKYQQIYATTDTAPRYWKGLIEVFPNLTTAYYCGRNEVLQTYGVHARPYRPS